MIISAIEMFTILVKGGLGMQGEPLGGAQYVTITGGSTDLIVFRIQPCLGASLTNYPEGVGLESVNSPGFYFRHKRSVIYITSTTQRTTTYDADTCWYLKDSLEHPGYVEIVPVNFNTRKVVYKAASNTFETEETSVSASYFLNKL